MFRGLILETHPLSYAKAARLSRLSTLMFKSMTKKNLSNERCQETSCTQTSSVAAAVGVDSIQCGCNIKARQFNRKLDFPVRCEWLDFLAHSCSNLFGPYMPNRSGIL